MSVGIAVLAVAGLIGSACAQVRGYTLDREGERVLCPNPYVLDYEIVDIQGDYLGGLWNPKDIFIDDDDLIYIADTGNDRVIKVDRNGVLLQEYGTSGPRDQRLRKPESVFVYADGTVLVADTFNRRLVKFSNDGEFLSEIGPPPESLMLSDEYEPIKVVGSDSGYMYVISRDDYNGILMFSDSGSATYFTMNRVKINWQRKWLEIFGSEEAKKQIAREIPMPHTNMYIADDGFMYTVSEFETKNQIKMINAVGESIYEEKFFGETVYWLVKTNEQILGRWSRPRFTDLTVNEFGVISAIDDTNKRVYQYDRDGNSLAVFGDMDERDSEDIFGSLASIDHDSHGNLYILDSLNSKVHVYRPTEYILAVHNAIKLDQEARYQEAAELWKDVIRLNGNFTLAYSGLGRAAYKQGLYKEAMDYYIKGEDREGYSLALTKYRYRFFTENFERIALFTVITIASIWALMRLVRWAISREDAKDSYWIGFLRAVVGMISHPGKTMEELKHSPHWSWAFILILAGAVVRLFNVYGTGFALRSIDPLEATVWGELAKVSVTCLLWIVVNYGVCMIMDGEGGFRQIALGTSFALVPYILSVVPLTLLSRFAVLDDASTFTALMTGVLIWMFVLIVIQIRVVHNFDAGQTVKSIAATVGGAISLVLVVGLGYGLVSQFVQFVREVSLEIRFR